jgi:hypothetical protein
MRLIKSSYSLHIFLICRTPLKFRGKVWQPLQKSDTTVKYFQIDQIPDMIDQPNPERIQFWNNIEKRVK